MAHNLTAHEHRILKSFIKQFLVEKNDRLIQDHAIELTCMTRLLNSVFATCFDFKASVTDVFKIFEEYGYTLSVAEPKQTARAERPYLETNSRAIYINISPITILELKAVAACRKIGHTTAEMLQIEDALMKLRAFWTTTI
ncbi:hypothetical protein MH928_09835 [Flavobacterium sp. WW92]|uniref:hypothetical protein n=1 Tax=unclassified Flavobacterium TaxID=196869 RepID=UPI0022251113|nr:MULTISPECIES: hypothetical protein [unclassified Flavobacterium]WDO11632.1 hypothetical protein MH928_09835 [Flavobacterium sp. WW92]